MCRVYKYDTTSGIVAEKHQIVYEALTWNTAVDQTVSFGC